MKEICLCADDEVCVLCEGADEDKFGDMLRQAVLDSGGTVIEVYKISNGGVER
ncbi:hypothetical protein [Mycolicibacterium stellerae]|uniref:hypothetical protein n=1 Tax=Mycolicibacterium stellerae TaxID=2358193 RepID=UPI0013DDCE64|nr:hypothetical protein [Mycolicibacterium stellerae]